MRCANCCSIFAPYESSSSNYRTPDHCAKIRQIDTVTYYRLQHAVPDCMLVVDDVVIGCPVQSNYPGGVAACRDCSAQ